MEYVVLSPLQVEEEEEEEEKKMMTPMVGLFFTLAHVTRHCHMLCYLFLFRLIHSE